MSHVLVGVLALALSYSSVFALIAHFGEIRDAMQLQWAALASVTLATLFCVIVIERRRWSLGLSGRPGRVVMEAFSGLAAGSLLIFSCDFLIRCTGGVSTVPGNGVEVSLLLTLFLPAAVHEELLFRGYLFQKILGWRRDAALGVTSLLFAAAHYRNQQVSWLAVFNIFLAGFLLGYAYLAFRRLWLPIGMHLSWNVVSGLLLGYPVSGFVLERSLFRTTPRGTPLISGGGFGIEASAMMSVCELAALWLAWRYVRRNEMSQPARAVEQRSSEPAEEVPPVANAGQE